MSNNDFSGRTALVTGGSRGIGRSCCLQLAQSGANVAVNYRSDEDAAQQTARAVEEAGGKALIVQADVSDQQQVEAMVAKVNDQLGPIDLLVNNAGIFHFAPHENTTQEIWQQTMNVNLTGPYLVSWAVKDGMIERGYGRIVNVSSISGLRPRPNSIAYAASKAGVIGLTKSLAEALAPHEVRVNAVAPGLIETEILDDVDQQVLDGIVSATPIPRIGQPEEIAELVCFLLSDRSSFMTGQTVVASGGRVMLP